MAVVGSNSYPGPWQSLFRQAMNVLAAATRAYGSAPFVTFGGGTVLMLRYGHRRSKDIDLFVSDSAFLSYASPRLNDDVVAGDYVEGHGTLKLILEEGEIDFVVAPNLLSAAAAYEPWQVLDHGINVETPAEIVKKMFHRGMRATPRDVFDLALVIEKEPRALDAARPFLLPHRDTFLEVIRAPNVIFKETFAAIDAMNYKPSLEKALALVSDYLDPTGDTARL